MDHHNITGIAPQLAEAVPFLLGLGFNADVRIGGLEGTANVLAIAYTTDRDNRLLAELTATGWAFTHIPIKGSGTRGVFRILTRL